MDDLARRLASLTPRRRSLLLRELDRTTTDPEIRIVPLGRSSWRFPASFGQQRLWFLDQLDPGNPTYNMPGAVRVRGSLDLAALADALNTVVARHEVLRTTIASDEGQAVQVIAPALVIEPLVIDLCSLEPAERETRSQSLAAEDARQRFDLAVGPLLRLTVLRLSDDDHIVLLNIHHIAADGWSVGLLVEELLTCYEARRTGQQADLPALPVQYSDYAVWQRRWLQGERLERQLAFWKQRLDGATPLLRLPTDRPRPPRQRYHGALHNFRLPADHVRALSALCRAHDTTPFMTLLAAFMALLGQESGQTDLVVGTPVAGRNSPEVERLIGFFVNTIVVRADLSGNPTFADLLAQVRRRCMEAYAHQDVPFERVVEFLQPERSPAYAPVFQVMFTFLNEPTRQRLHAAGSGWQLLEIDRGTANRDLTLRMEEIGPEVAGYLEYNSELFDEASARRLASRFTAILTDALASPDVRIGTLGRREGAEATGPTRPDRVARASRQRFEAVLAKPPAALSREAIDWVEIAPLIEGRRFPLVVRPKVDGIDLAGWIIIARACVEDYLRRSGGLLFRGFGLSGAAAMERFARACSGELFGYEEASTPRRLVEGQVYTSTEYPPDQSIMLHNEMAYCHRWPLKIWFHCARAAAEGGSTPVADSREVYHLLSPDLRDRFTRKRVQYIRNYGPEVDIPWPRVFGTTDRAAVEAYCRQAGIRWEWNGAERLRTLRVGPATVRHPRTGELVWFNSAHMFHVWAHEATVRESLCALFAEEELPRHARFGDGDPIGPEEIHQIRDAYRRAAVRFDWQEGDVLMLDNMLAAHGRDPFKGERSVLVAMAEPITEGGD